MNILPLSPVPDACYAELGYPLNGKCADMVVISAREADAYYEAAAECFRMVDAATEHVITNRLYDEIGISDFLIPLIERTYTDYQRHPHMLGRFDFAGGTNGVPIKLLEFNADTPFSIFEVSTVQYALAKFHGLNPDERQYNRLFEELQNFFAYLAAQIKNPSVLFTNAADGEDDLNTQLLMEAAAHVLPGDYAHWTDVCIDGQRGFCTVNGEYIRAVYNVIVKMVPWDLLCIEDVHMARSICKTMTEHPEIVVCNPPYSAIYQSKGLLKIMYDLFPDSPYLLKTSFETLSGAHVRKPIWGREGNNITLYDKGAAPLSTPGFYADQKMIWQEKAEFATHEDKYYQAGVFISMDTPCGLGFRRSSSKIITTDDDLCGHIVESVEDIHA